MTVGEVVFNGDVWKELSPTQQEIIKSAANETFLVWWTKWQRQNADALTEMQSRVPNSVFLAKPFSLSELAATVQKQMLH